MSEVFGNTITQLILLFAFIAVGFLFGKKGIIPKEAAGTLSKLETWLFMPALALRNCANNCQMENVTEYIQYIGISAVVVIVLFAIARFLAGKFARKESDIGIYSYALTVANCGYMGYPMMQAMFGDVMLFKMMITAIPVNIYIYTLGMAMMTKGKASFRSLVNPVFIGTALGIIIGLSGITVPPLVDGFLASASGCMSPVAMLIAGLVISRLKLSELFGDVRVYLAASLRLIFLPAALIAVLALLGVGTELLTIMLVLYAMPIGMNTIVFPEAHGINAKTGAGLVLISNLASIVTIPLMVLLFLQIFPI